MPVYDPIPVDEKRQAGEQPEASERGIQHRA